MFIKLKLIIKALRIYLYDLRNDIRYTTLATGKLSSQEKLLSSLVVATHTIEKGLTMPNKRIPFGEAKAVEIVHDCNSYIEKGYDTSESRFQSVLSTMSEYRITCGGGGIFQGLFDDIKLLEKFIKIPIVSQKYNINQEDYFSHTKDDFKKFSESRYSCRNLTGHVDDSILQDALSLSMRAPSTCNRQSHRVHLLQSSESKRIILSIQSGNRGFGDLADQFILVTSDLSDWPGMHQRNAPYVDGGIYLMNLLYCLHYFDIAACTLNLYLDTDRTKRMYEGLGIPRNEVPIALVAIGMPPEHFDLACSHRRNVIEIISHH